MQTSTFNSVLTKLAIASISSYQKYLSPHKGFSCAHRLLYGDASCSQYFKYLIAEEGLHIAIKVSKGRFQACREASYILKASRNSQNRICRATRSSQNYIFAVNENPELTEPEDESDLEAISLEDDDSENEEVSEDRESKAEQPKNQVLQGVGDFCECSGNACIVFEACSDLPALDCGDCGAIGDCGSCGS